MKAAPGAVFRGRWKRDVKLLDESGLQFSPREPATDLWVWFDGPEDSPYEGGRFKLHIVLNDYPIHAPSVTMETLCYNPYISQDGRICCSIFVCERNAAHHQQHETTRQETAANRQSGTR